jgi:hypothetical protein
MRILPRKKRLEKELQEFQGRLGSFVEYNQRPVALLEEYWCIGARQRNAGETVEDKADMMHHGIIA